MSAENTFAERFLAEAREILARLDTATIENAAYLLAETRMAGGRLFILGVGGGAGHASHAVNDFRKIAGIEAYSPTDNAAELTAVAPEVLADSLSEYLQAWGRRIKNGESGALPIVVGLIVIIIFFQAERSKFDSAINLVNLLQQSAIYIMLGAAEVFALILSEIDLSVGFMLAFGGWVMAELVAPPVNLPWWLAILSICLFGLLAFLLHPKKTDSK